MRTISAALDAAQRQASRDPVIAAAVRNDVECVRRLDYESLNTTSQTATKHDVAVTGNGTVIRVRITGGAVKINRVEEADVGTPVNFDSWSDLQTGMGSQVAVAAAGDRVLVAYSDSVGTRVRYRESTDDGQSFSADASWIFVAATIIDLAAAYKDSAGDAGVFLVTASAVRGAHRVSGVIGSLLTDGTTYSATSAIAAIYGIGTYDLLVTGTEITTLKPTVWSQRFTPGADTWGTPQPQFQADSGLTTFAAPFLTFIDTWRANFVELPLYTGGITRTWRTYLHPLETWNRTAFLMRSQLPTHDHLTVGTAIANGNGYAYESSTAMVRRAPTSLVELDIAADILALEIRESTDDAYGWIDLVNPDDAGGARRYALDPPPPIKLGNRIVLGFGYRTADDTYSGHVLQHDPVAYYRLGESSGQPQDSSGNGNHTTATGGTPTYAQTGAIAGDSDTAIRLDKASSEYFTAPDSATLDVGDVFSIEVWVKRHSIGGAFPTYIVSKEIQAYELRFNTGNTISLIAGGNVIASSNGTTGKIEDTTLYHHIVVTKNGADIHIYLDGDDVTEPSSVENHTATNNTTPLNIGRTNNDEFHIDATLDELAIYDVALSASHVAAHFAQEAAGGGLEETSTIQDLWITAMEHRRDMRRPLRAPPARRGHLSPATPLPAARLRHAHRRRLPTDLVGDHQPRRRIAQRHRCIVTVRQHHAAIHDRSRHVGAHGDDPRARVPRRPGVCIVAQHHQPQGARGRPQLRLHIQQPRAHHGRPVPPDRDAAPPDRIAAGRRSVG
jgi:hypothetical protein